MSDPERLRSESATSLGSVDETSFFDARSEEHTPGGMPQSSPSPSEPMGDEQDEELSGPVQSFSSFVAGRHAAIPLNSVPSISRRMAAAVRRGGKRAGVGAGQSVAPAYTALPRFPNARGGGPPRFQPTAPVTSAASFHGGAHMVRLPGLKLPSSLDTSASSSAELSASAGAGAGAAAAAVTAASNSRQQSPHPPRPGVASYGHTGSGAPPPAAESYGPGPSPWDVADEAAGGEGEGSGEEAEAAAAVAAAVAAAARGATKRDSRLDKEKEKAKEPNIFDMFDTLQPSAAATSLSMADFLAAAAAPPAHAPAPAAAPARAVSVNNGHAGAGAGAGEMTAMAMDDFDRFGLGPEEDYSHDHSVSGSGSGGGGGGGGRGSDSHALAEASGAAASHRASNATPSEDPAPPSHSQIPHPQQQQQQQGALVRTLQHRQQQVNRQQQQQQQQQHGSAFVPVTAAAMPPVAPGTLPLRPTATATAATASAASAATTGLGGVSGAALKPLAAPPRAAPTSSGRGSARNTPTAGTGTGAAAAPGATRHTPSASGVSGLGSVGASPSAGPGTGPAPAASAGPHTHKTTPSPRAGTSHSHSRHGSASPSPNPHTARRSGTSPAAAAGGSGGGGGNGSTSPDDLFTSTLEGFLTSSTVRSSDSGRFSITSLASPAGPSGGSGNGSGSGGGGAGTSLTRHNSVTAAAASAVTAAAAAAAAAVGSSAHRSRPRPADPISRAAAVAAQQRRAHASGGAGARDDDEDEDGGAVVTCTRAVRLAYRSVLAVFGLNPVIPPYGVIQSKTHWKDWSELTGLALVQAFEHTAHTYVRALQMHSAAAARRAAAAERRPSDSSSTGSQSHQSHDSLNLAPPPPAPRAGTRAPSLPRSNSASDYGVEASALSFVSSGGDSLLDSPPLPDRPPLESIWGLAFSADGAYLAVVGGTDGGAVVRLWRVRPWAENAAAAAATGTGGAGAAAGGAAAAATATHASPGRMRVDSLQSIGSVSSADGAAAPGRGRVGGGGGGASSAGGGQGGGHGGGGASLSTAGAGGTGLIPNVPSLPVDATLGATLPVVREQQPSSGRGSGASGASSGAHSGPAAAAAVVAASRRSVDSTSSQHLPSSNSSVAPAVPAADGSGDAVATAEDPAATAGAGAGAAAAVADDDSSALEDTDADTVNERTEAPHGEVPVPEAGPSHSDAEEEHADDAADDEEEEEGGPEGGGGEGLAGAATADGLAVEGTTGDLPDASDDEDGTSAPQLVCHGAPLFDPVPFREWLGHESHIVSLSWSRFSPGLLLTASMDGFVRLWHTSRRECLHKFQHPDCVTAVCFHPTVDSVFLTGCFDRKLRLWSLESGKVMTWALCPSMITAAAISPDGKYIVAGLYNGTVSIFHADTMKLATSVDLRRRRGPFKRGRKITGLSFTRTGSHVLVTSNDSRIHMVSLSDFSRGYRYYGFSNHNMQIHASIDGSGERLISGSEDGRIYIWRTRNDQYVPAFNPRFTGYTKRKVRSWESFEFSYGRQPAQVAAMLAAEEAAVVPADDEAGAGGGTGAGTGAGAGGAPVIPAISAALFVPQAALDIARPRAAAEQWCTPPPGLPLPCIGVPYPPPDVAAAQAAAMGTAPVAVTSAAAAASASASAPVAAQAGSGAASGAAATAAAPAAPPPLTPLQAALANHMIIVAADNRGFVRVFENCAPRARV